ncbi:MAG TPA: glycosyltransferase family 39 protein [Actinomycetes bacterium]|nr:glycosyltransferase family 39 protein [Actinomycetes bacterium]
MTTRTEMHAEPAADRQSPAAPGRWLRSPAALAAFAVVVGVAIRLWYLSTPQATLDGDEAMTGLMVRRILDGHWYAYLAGQRYNGAIEQYLQAVVWAMLPQNPFTLRLTQVALAALVIVMIYLVGARMLATRWHAALAALLFATGPFFNIWKGVRSHGAYPTAQLIGLAGVYCALRLRERYQRRWLLGLAAACGLGLWASWSAAFLLIPAAVYALPALWRHARGRWSDLALAGLALLLGYVPALVWAVAHGSVPLLGGSQPHRTAWERMESLASPVLREFVGVGYRYGRPGWPIAAQFALIAVLGAAYLVAVFRRLGPRGRSEPASRPTDILLLAVPVTALLYAMSKYTWFIGEPRYLFAAYPAFALGVAALLPAAGRRAVAAGAAVTLLWVGTSAGLLAAHHDDGFGDLSACYRSVAGWLQSHGSTVVYSDYWTGLPMQLAAGDRITVGLVEGGHTKFPENRRAADALADPVYVAGHVIDPMDLETDDVALLDRTFAAHGMTTQRSEVACTVVYQHWRPLHWPWELGIGYPPLPPARQ